jgi:hypothetical protein
VELPITHLEAYGIYNSISFYHIPFKKALYRGEDKESPGVFSLVAEGYKGHRKKCNCNGVYVYVK